MEENESRPPLGGLIILFVGAAFITVGVVFLTYGLYSLVRSGTWPEPKLSTIRRCQSSKSWSIGGVKLGRPAGRMKVHSTASSGLYRQSSSESENSCGSI